MPMFLSFSLMRDWLGAVESTSGGGIRYNLPFIKLTYLYLDYTRLETAILATILCKQYYIYTMQIFVSFILDIS